MNRFSVTVFLAISGAAVFCSVPTSWAQKQAIPHNQDAPPGPALSPQEAVAKMTVPPGFQVEVVASEPDIVNPVAMTFDERGRVWITESLEYPRRSAGLGRDRIKILEDTNGDGHMDKVTIFAEGLNIPSGIAVGYGGVWVANSPDILFLEDTDGDDKADRQSVVVTGFGRTDTHELPNSLTWGPDGWLYGLNGVFNYSHVEHQGKTYDFTCAMFRINPRTHEFELFAKGTSNPWGIAWDGEGSAFISACVIDHLWHITESGYYHRQGGPYPPFTWKLGSIVKHHHQKAAYCGIHYFDSDAYPEQYRGRLYMGNIHGNCLNVDELSRDGSTYFAKPNNDFLSANDAWFMPVAQKTGPDGCLYVLDWYDQYHCYQDANRDPAGIDRLKGRLYRIRYRGTPRAKQLNMGLEDDDQLIARLSSQNSFIRRTAQRLLGEHAWPESQNKLQELVLSQQQPRQVRLAAMWALISTGTLNGDFHKLLLQHEDATIRAWGVRAAGNMKVSDAEIRHLVWNAATDKSPDVQLQSVVAMAKLDPGGEYCVEPLVRIAALSGQDKLLPHIVWNNLQPLLEQHSDLFLQELSRHDLVRSPGLSDMMPYAVERILARKKSDPTAIITLVEMLLDSSDDSSDHGSEAARDCLETLAAKVQSHEIQGRQLSMLRNRLQPRLAQLITRSVSHPLRIDAALLACTWKDDQALRAVRLIVANTSQSDDIRLRAVQALVAAEDEDILKIIEQHLTSSQWGSSEFRGQVLSALGTWENPRIAKILLKHLDELEPKLRPRVIELLTQRPQWASTLVSAVATEDVDKSLVNLNQIRRLQQSSDKSLVRRAVEIWGVVRDKRDPARELVIARMRGVLRRTAGDAIRGQQVYNRVCGQCHKLHGVGEEVGPDITVNGRNSYAQLLSNVFDPSLVIGASYQARTVITADGRVLTGLLVEDGPQRIVLKMQGGKTEFIARSQVDEVSTSVISLMPENLEQQLTQQELIDLFALLILDKPPSDAGAKRLPGVEVVLAKETSNRAEFSPIVEEVLPGFVCQKSGLGGVALIDEYRGRAGVLRTHPVNRQKAAELTRKLDVPKSGKTELVLLVSNDKRGDWQLQVFANSDKLLDTVVKATDESRGWEEHRVDLSKYAGQKVDIHLLNAPNDWRYEFAYWARADIVTDGVVLLPGMLLSGNVAGAAAAESGESPRE